MRRRTRLAEKIDMRPLRNRSAVGSIRDAAAFTLVEVVVSMLVVGIMMAGLVSLYTQSAMRAEWSAYSLADK